MIFSFYNTPEPPIEPTEEEPRLVCYCDVCGEPIREGDTYYKIQQLDVCEFCVDDAETIAEVEE